MRGGQRPGEPRRPPSGPGRRFPPFRAGRGADVSAYTAPLDDLFTAGPWDTVAIGDGGNEIGTGAVPHTIIAEHVSNGEVIACTTPSRHLIVAGVSNWGAYALIGALSILGGERWAAAASCLDEELDGAILDAMVACGPAVDGVSGRRAPTVDGLSHARHREMLPGIQRVVTGR